MSLALKELGYKNFNKLDRDNSKTQYDLGPKSIKIIERDKKCSNLPIILKKIIDHDHSKKIKIKIQNIKY